MNTKKNMENRLDDNTGALGNRNCIMCSILFAPEQSNAVLSQIRFF